MGKTVRTGNPLTALLVDKLGGKVIIPQELGDHYHPNRGYGKNPTLVIIQRSDDNFTLCLNGIQPKMG